MLGTGRRHRDEARVKPSTGRCRPDAHGCLDDGSSSVALAIRAHVLQVGHHGSKTSTRAAFLAAVSPALALISAGPKKYGGVVLPDQAIVDELEAAGVTVLRTDVHDGACPAPQRLGSGKGPGGCDSWVVTIDQRAVSR